MSPVLVAQGLYKGPRDFLQDLNQHLVHGYVISTPSLFAMGRPVEKDAEPRLLQNIRWQFDRPDCWLVWSASGALWRLADMLPIELPYIAFHRRTDPELRIYSTERLRHLAGLPRHPHRTSTPTP